MKFENATGVPFSREGLDQLGYSRVPCFYENDVGGRAATTYMNLQSFTRWALAFGLAFGLACGLFIALWFSHTRAHYIAL